MEEIFNISDDELIKRNYVGICYNIDRQRWWMKIWIVTLYFFSSYFYNTRPIFFKVLDEYLLSLFDTFCWEYFERYFNWKILSQNGSFIIFDDNEYILRIMFHLICHWARDLIFYRDYQKICWTLVIKSFLKLLLKADPPNTNIIRRMKIQERFRGIHYIALL